MNVGMGRSVAASRLRSCLPKPRQRRPDATGSFSFLILTEREVQSGTRRREPHSWVSTAGTAGLTSCVPCWKVSLLA